MVGFVIRLLITALGIWLASEIVPGVHMAGVSTLLAAALLLGIVNAIVRPIVILLTLPITVVTLGVFLLVINAAMLGLVARLLKGFMIDGFFPAVLASIIVSITSWFASSFVGSRGDVEVIYTRHKRH